MRQRLWADAVWARTAALVIVGALLLGCRQGPAVVVSENQGLRLVEAKADTGLALRISQRRDTVTSEDRGPVELLYAIVNGPRPVSFDNDPGRFRILVTGPDGQPATSLGGAGPTSGRMGQFEMMLPAGASVIQRQDLRCVHDGAYSAVPILPSKDECLAMYALRTPGTYRVVVEYFGPEGDTMAVDGKNRAPTQGLHLADTTTFVVAAGS